MFELRWPRADESDQFERLLDVVRWDHPNFLFNYRDGMSVTDYLRELQAMELEQTDTAVVPCTVLFAYQGQRIVGRLSVRHHLNPRLLRIGGHVGYAVLPEFRNRGIATWILGQGVAMARSMHGIDPVLVTCDTDNWASRKVIERNGGILEDIINDPELTSPRMRFWIHANTPEEA